MGMFSINQEILLWKYIFQMKSRAFKSSLDKAWYMKVTSALKAIIRYSLHVIVSSRLYYYAEQLTIKCKHKSLAESDYIYL